MMTEANGGKDKRGMATDTRDGILAAINEWADDVTTASAFQ